MTWVRFCILIFVIGGCQVGLYAQAFQEHTDNDLESMVSEKFIQESLLHFVNLPHPMGSSEQKAYSVFLEKRFQKLGMHVSVQPFEDFTPRKSSQKNDRDIRGQNRQEVTSGHNVIAVRRGVPTCGILIGGHYDTKYFQQFRFVGANDGGSSTALILELARIAGSAEMMKQIKHKFDAETWKECTLIFTLFDGEEAVLAEWEDGERLFGKPDHLYGSRYFARNLKRGEGVWLFNGIPIKLALIFDMIGHKNQSLSMTRGSDRNVMNQFLSVSGTTKLSAATFELEDDHSPLAAIGIPFVHVIDWDNIQEWHTKDDNMSIVSAKKIAEFTRVILRFLQLKR